VGNRQSRYIGISSYINVTGRQLFTGSFHPVEDKLWEDRRGWDRRVAPKEAVSLREIFEQRVIIRMATIRNTAAQVLSSLSPFIGFDLINIILHFLSDGDLARMNAICKTPKATMPTITPTSKISAVPIPSSSCFLGFDFMSQNT
jgi:hypothetical protein